MTTPVAWERLRVTSLRASVVDALVPAALAAFVIFCVLGEGLPELRHDWRIPAGFGTAGPWIAGMIDGWLPGGIGNPQPYPTFYLVGLALWPLHFLANTFALTALIVGVTIVVAVRAAMSLVGSLGGVASTRVAAGIFAALNPWVYAKYVTGHVFMIFTYAIVLAIVAETVRARPRPYALVVLSALSITQLEYAIFAILPLLGWAVRRREYRMVAATLLAASPIAFGIASSYRTIGATPFNFVWQQGQSMEPFRVALLTGPQFGYGQIFERFWPATSFVLIFALVGLPGAFADRRTRALVALGIAAAILATGAKGPFAFAYFWAVVHIAEIGVFRELYDLVGFVAIASIVGFGFGLGRNVRAGALLALTTLSLAGAWLWVPPRSFFAGPSVPSVTLPPDPTHRVALSPFFQPLGVRGKGSGVDPDAYVHVDRSLPFNEAFPLYPVDVALAKAAHVGDDRELAALAVSTVIARSYLATDYRSLRYQWPYRDPFRVVAQRTRKLAAAPILGFSMRGPQVATIANGSEENAVFFGDDDLARIRTFEPTRATNDPDVAWVDARLAVPLHPDWGTAFGGVTTRGAQPLDLPPHAAFPAVLALADGTLEDDAGHIVAERSSRLHWWPLAREARFLRCAGTCLVVLLGAPPPGLAEHASAQSLRPIDVRFATSWFATASVPANAAGYLRFDVRYDPAWVAVRSGRVLEHRRLATALNLWRLDGSGRSIYFIERTVAIQFALEIFAFFAVLALASIPARRRFNA